MQRRLLSVAAIALLVGGLAACGDSGDDGGDESAACSPIGSSVTVGALDRLEFDADSYSADAGCVGFTYRNEGSIAHTLLIKGEDGFKLSVGDTDEGAIELDAGSYTLYCDIAGHEAAGMEAELTVE